MLNHIYVGITHLPSYSWLETPIGVSVPIFVLVVGLSRKVVPGGCVHVPPHLSPLSLVETLLHKLSVCRHFLVIGILVVWEVLYLTEYR